MDKNQKKEFPLSYESDGKMGKKESKNKEKLGDRNAEMFFNITQDSE